MPPSDESEGSSHAHAISSSGIAPKFCDSPASAVEGGQAIRMAGLSAAVRYAVLDRVWECFRHRGAAVGGGEALQNLACTALKLLSPYILV